MVEQTNRQTEITTLYIQIIYLYLGLDEDEGILSQVLAESQQEYLESLKRKAEEEKVNIINPQYDEGIIQ